MSFTDDKMYKNKENRWLCQWLKGRGYSDEEMKIFFVILKENPDLALDWGLTQ